MRSISFCLTAGSNEHSPHILLLLPGAGVPSRDRVVRLHLGDFEVEVFTRMIDGPYCGHAPARPIAVHIMDYEALEEDAVEFAFRSSCYISYDCLAPAILPYHLIVDERDVLGQATRWGE